MPIFCYFSPIKWAKNWQKSKFRKIPRYIFLFSPKVPWLQISSRYNQNWRKYHAARAHARVIYTEIMAIFWKMPIFCFFSMKNITKSLFTSRKLIKSTFLSNLVPYIYIKKQIGDIFRVLRLFMLDLGNFAL